MEISLQQLEVTAYTPFRLYKYEADLYIDNKLACKVKNTTGKPGSAEYLDVVQGMEQPLNLAKQQYLEKPDRVLYLDETGFPSTFESNLAMAIEDLLIKMHDPQKELRDQIKLSEKMEKGIVFGHAGHPVESYKSLYHQEADLNTVLSSEYLREQFMEWFRVMRPGMWEPGMVVFNKNISREDAAYLGIEKFMQQNTQRKIRNVLSDGGKKSKRPSK